MCHWGGVPVQEPHVGVLTMSHGPGDNLLGRGQEPSERTLWCRIEGWEEEAFPDGAALSPVVWRS